MTDLTEARPLLRTELNVKLFDGGQLTSGLVDYAATLDFVLEDFVRYFPLPTLKYKTNTTVRLANGQRVTSSVVCEIEENFNFELAKHEFKRTFNVRRDLRALDMMLA
jgi:hypothetical protein